MNKATRKRLADVVKLLEQAQEMLDGALADLEDIRDEEDEKLQNVPENLQGSEKYEAQEEAVDGLMDACDDFDGVQTAIDDLIEKINEIRGE